MSRAIRILQVVGSMERAGTETWLMHVLRNLDRERFHMDFLVHTDRECPYNEEIESLGSKLYLCGEHSNPARYSFKFLKILKEHGPFDVVHSHMHYFNGLVMRLAELGGVPTRIAHSHTDTAILDRTSSLSRRVYLRTSRRWIRRYASKRVAVSNRAADSLFGGGWRSDRNTSLMFCGLDFSAFQLPTDPGEVRREFGFAPDDFVVGHVGRFMPVKNHEFLMRIHAEILSMRPNARLLLIGQGPLQEKVREIAAELGTINRVTFAGSRPDVARLMLGAMDAFVMPSLYEGLGLAAVEAQAAGLPTFLSDQMPPEADTGCGLVHFLPLEQPARLWATAILNRAESSVSQGNALMSVCRSRFGLKQNLDGLCRLYSAQ